MISWAHLSPQPKQHLDWFCRFCPYTLQWDAPSPQICPFPWGDLDLI